MQSAVRGGANRAVVAETPLDTLNAFFWHGMDSLTIQFCLTWLKGSTGMGLLTIHTGIC